MTLKRRLNYSMKQYKYIYEFSHSESYNSS